MIENYIFDLYGTLVDIHTDESMPSLWQRMALLISLQGAAYTPRELQSAYQGAVAEQIELCKAKRPNIRKEHIEPDIIQVFKSLYVQKSITPSDDKIDDIALFFRMLSLKHLRLYPGVKTVLGTLRSRGKGVYLLSNAQAAFTLPELEKLGLTPCFDGMVLSSDAGVKKPDKAIFEFMLSKYDLRPETCLMIGNDLEADMGGAATVGMAGRYIHTSLSPECRGPLPPLCREIQDLRELL